MDSTDSMECGSLCSWTYRTYRKEDIQRLEAFKMWVYRRMEKVSWRDMKTNEEVLQLVQEKRSLMDLIWRRKNNWIDHILRGESLLKEVIEGWMIGKRPRGRKQLGMLNEFLKALYSELKRKAKTGTNGKHGSQRTCL